MILEKREYDVCENIGGQDIDICEYMEEYNSGYICDVVSEVADQNVSIYTHELLDMTKDLYFSDYVNFEEAIEMSDKSEFTSALSMAQYMYNETVLNENIEAILYNMGINRIQHIEECTQEIYEECFNTIYADTNDSGGLLETFLDRIEEAVNEVIEYKKCEE